MSTVATAQKIYKQFKKELPHYDDLPIQEFEAKTTLYDVIPHEDPGLSYKVRLPKSWTESKSLGWNVYKTSDKVLGEIVRYYSEARLDSRSRFSLDVLELSHEISALHWFMHYTITNSIMLQGIEEYGKSKIEALYIIVENGTSYAVRAIAQITGNRIVLAKFYTPIAYWKEERALQDQVMRSFSLKYPKDRYIEDLKTIYFLDIAQMKYPQSWFVKEPNMRSVDYMSLRLVNLSKSNTLDGKIDINLISTYSDKDLQSQYEWHKKEIEKTGLRIQSLIDKAEDGFNLGSDMDFGFVDVYKALNVNTDIINYELWIAVMAGEGYFYYVTLLTPARDEEFFVWSKNVEAMKIVVQNLRKQ